eukprot:TRINITY_DN11846_c0_g1_i1.p1 TRINITY_DN11846_c0_g1~~TRINITY_DN11846_c0_g1_i1.p1  ORF type:complete len:346 (-),score=56.27 TRINITY_DN11846_c0_g1_i1:73-1110(-)
MTHHIRKSDPLFVETIQCTSDFTSFEKKILNEQMSGLMDENARLRDIISRIKNDTEDEQYRTQMEIETLKNLLNNSLREIRTTNSARNEELNRLIIEKINLQEENDKLGDTIKLLSNEVSKLTSELEYNQDMIDVKISEADSFKNEWKKGMHIIVEKDKEICIANKKVLKLQEALDRFRFPDPQYAVERLYEYKDSMYMYSIKSYEEKEILLDYAIQTHDLDVVCTVILYLEYSLNNEKFTNIIENHEDCIKYYLRYLKNNNRDKFKYFCIEFNRFKELGLFMLDTAMEERNIKMKYELLGECIQYFTEHENLLGEYLEDIKEAYKSTMIDLKLVPIPIRVDGWD